MISTDPPEVHEAQWSGLTGTIGYDIGAHHGENFDALRKAGCTKIVAYEPELELFDQLLATEGDSDVICLSDAVAGEDGFLEMRHANGMLGNLTGSGRILVRCVALDSAVLEHGTPDLAVVDVEGFEGLVLRGAKGLLASGRVSWLIEFHSEPLYHIVTGALLVTGYQPQTIRHPHYPAGSGLWLGHGWIKAIRPGPASPASS
jgi:FkbM family methyltransferase